MAEEPRYTIEQIELLRRLLGTGLSRDDIIYAIDSMMRFDREFGGCSSYLRVGEAPLPSPTPRVETGPLPSPTHQQQPSPQSSSVSRLDQMSADQMLSDVVDTTTYQLSPVAQPMASTSPASSIQPSFQPALKVDEYQVSEEEIRSLLSKGLPLVRDEIREFLAQNNLSQNQLGRDIGVTGSYISQYFHSVRSMRNGTVTRMCKWYIGKKRELEVPEVPPPSVSQYAPQPGYDAFLRSPNNRYNPYGNPDSNKVRLRRERFVWKEGCTSILEAYFKRNAYPTDVERIRLSDTCNGIQQIPGHTIPESCVVTPERVYHWFANRRKEINKRKRLANTATGSQSVEVAVAITEETPMENGQCIPLPGLTAEQVDDNRESETVVIDNPGIELDDDHPRDPKEIANELQEVNNSIITFMKAVEEKAEENNKPDVVLNE